MRLYFPNLTRPKKAAKAIADKLGVPLSSVHKAVARIVGYSDWHDLEQNYSKHDVSALDQHLEQSDFIERQARLTLRLAQELQTFDGDTQYALAGCRLTGDRPILLSDQIAIRLRCWRLSVLPPVAKRMRGAIGKLKSPGRNGEVVILRSFGRPTSVITQKNVGGVADFEYISPKVSPDLFMPMRLYLPYGYWVEEDDSKVLFARDYKPMWRIRDGAEPERLEPWLWIKHKKMIHLWEEVYTPWNSSALKQSLEAFLFEAGIQTLPIWADALPLLVHSDKLRNFSKAVEPLQNLRVPQKTAA